MTTTDRGIAAGADVGATLVKLAVRDAGSTSTATLPADASWRPRDSVSRAVARRDWPNVWRNRSC